MAHNPITRIGDTQRPPRTTCKICQCSIFTGDETSWVVSPNPGLAHKLCADEARKGPPRNS